MQHFRLKYPAAGSANETMRSRFSWAIGRAATTKDALLEAAKIHVDQFDKMLAGKDVKGIDMTALAGLLKVNPVWLWAGSNAPRRVWPDGWEPKNKPETA